VAGRCATKTDILSAMDLPNDPDWLESIRTLDVRKFLTSPRHAYHFRKSGDTREKIRRRRDEALETDRICGKVPIVNVEEERDLVELHDGNASVVAWLLYAGQRGIAPTLEQMRKGFDEVILLRARVHESGEAWHPFLPPECANAKALQTVMDAEQGREVPKALTTEGVPVYFDDRDFFSGVDSCEPLGSVADDVLAMMR